MKRVKLGNSNLTISQQGLGCMGMSEFYGPTDEPESLATLDRALKLGINFFDTADVYGLGRNEELLGKAFRDRRDEVIIATKFAIERTETAMIGTLRTRKSARISSSCITSMRRAESMGTPTT